MEDNYKFEFTVFGFDCHNFKQKQVSFLRNTIERSRLGLYLKFNSFGETIFNELDKSLRYPITSINKEYNRNRSNCIVYNIVDEYPCEYTKYYDKLFIYQYIGKSDSYYSAVFYNSNTNKYFHKFLIEYDLSELCINISKILYNLERNATLTDKLTKDLESIKQSKIKRASDILNMDISLF